MGANAQTSVPAFTAGQVLTAQQQTEINTGVPVFATTADRDAAFGGTGEKTLAEGQACYIEAAPQRLEVYNGTAWVDFDLAGTSFTPTFTNLTVGNGTLAAKYHRFGSFVYVEVRLTWGSTTAITGSVDMTFPFTSTTYVSGHFMGMTRYIDSGSSQYIGTMVYINTTTIRWQRQTTAGTVEIRGAEISAAAPFTWTTNDIMTCQYMYEAA